MFDNLFNDLERKFEATKGQEAQYVDMSIMNDPSLYPELYKDYLKNLDLMDETRLFQVINGSLSVILKNIKLGNNDYEDIRYFKNKKFLNCLINVLARKQDLKLEDICMLNKIAYQYLNSKQQGLPLKDEITEMVKMTNKKYIAEIEQLTDMSQNSGLILTLAYFSTGVKGLNTALLTLDEKITEQKVIYIYETFNELLRVTQLFESVMFNTGLPLNTKERIDRFSIIQLAVLTILNSQPVQAIRLVLIDYVNSYNYPTLACKPIMFSIYTLNPQDFDRILFVANNLKNEGIMVP